MTYACYPSESTQRSKDFHVKATVSAKLANEELLKPKLNFHMHMLSQYLPKKTSTTDS